MTPQTEIRSKYLCVGPLLAVLCLAFAPAPFPRAKRPALDKADLERMQGEWACVSCIIEGTPHNSAHPGSATIKGDRIAFGRPEDTWRLTLDASGTTKRIDFHRVKPLGGIDLFLGIYRLDGNRLTICSRICTKEKHRPTSFDPTQPKVWVQVYQRKKP